MADYETETNPRKKIKIHHRADQNGDLTEANEVQAESSEVIQNKEEDKERKIDSNATEGDIARKDEIEKEKEDNPGKIGDDQSNRNLDIDDSDDDVKMEEGTSGKDIDVSDAESDVSALSEGSSLSGEDTWKAVAAGPMAWVMRCMEDGVNPRSILAQIIPDENDIPDVDDYILWKLVVNLVSEPPPRNKLPDINTLEDVVNLLQKCEKIMVLTGAGVSVSCGIPDFRSRNGIYARLAVDFPDLPDPQAMFDIKYFKNDQRPFFKFAKEIYPGQFEPSKSHKFIKLIEDHGKLLRNYTQNIDTLEQVAGIKNVIQCHGSFATATCMTCHHKCSSDDIKEQIMEQVIPLCPQCDPQTPLSVMKPDIVFFGESLPEEFHHQMSVDKDDCDLLIVIGSSLKVRPVALIPNSLPAHVPQILINKEHLRNLNFDVELLGNCDVIISEICRRLGNDWTKIASSETMTQIGMDELITPTSSPNRQENKSNVSEKKTEEKAKEFKDNEKQSENSETSGKDSTAGSEVANDSEKESGTDCQCNKESKSSTDLDKELSNETHVCKSTEKPEAQAEVKDKIPPESESKNLPQIEADSSANVSVNDDKSEVNEITSGHEKSSETEKVSKGVENGKVSDDVKPGSSREDNEKPGSSTDLQNVRNIWAPGRQNIALRLGTNQFCYIPPYKYIFPEAEYFRVVRSSSESEGCSDMDRDTTMDSSRELNLTHTTTDSSAIEGDVIDLTTDDEDEKVGAKDESMKMDSGEKAGPKDERMKTFSDENVGPKDESMKTISDEKVGPKDESMKTLSDEKVGPKDESMKTVSDEKVGPKVESNEKALADISVRKDIEIENKTDDAKEISKGAGDKETEVIGVGDTTAEVLVD